MVTRKDPDLLLPAGTRSADCQTESCSQPHAMDSVEPAAAIPLALSDPPKSTFQEDVDIILHLHQEGDKPHLIPVNRVGIAVKIAHIDGEFSEPTRLDNLLGPVGKIFHRSERSISATFTASFVEPRFL